MEPLTPTSRSRDFLVRWRSFQTEPVGKSVSISITASFTVDPIVPALGCFLAQRGLAPTFALAPFNQIYQSLLDPSSILRHDPGGVTVVLPRIEDLCEPVLTRLAMLDGGEIASARAEAAAEIDRLCGVLSEFVKATGGKTALLVGTLPPPYSLPLGILDASHPASLRALYHELNLKLCQEVRRVRGARLLDIAELVDRAGTETAYDMRRWHLARCPFSDSFVQKLAWGLSRMIAPLHVAPAKVLVLDLDNTLWGGILGEDGPSGIALGDSGPGSAYVAFQDALLALRRQGLLLAVASKNNEGEALTVLDTHPEMRIRRKHLAGWRISWQRKSESLRELAAELSVGLSSFVFVDDNPVEREEVRQLAPEVTVLPMPQDPAEYVAALRALPELDRAAITEEDTLRADMYAIEKARAAVAPPSEDGNPAALRAYLEGLELKIGVARLSPEGIARAAQLTQKTNQFNLTTIRRSEAEVTALLADPTWRLYSLEVSDRFGDYGTVGMLFAQRKADVPDTFILETMLLSCRVLGRAVETAFLASAAEDLWRAGARHLLGRFEPTSKNGPAAEFLSKHGFRKMDDGHLLMLDLDEARFQVPHITVVNRPDFDRRPSGVAL